MTQFAESGIGSKKSAEYNREKSAFQRKLKKKRKETGSSEGKKSKKISLNRGKKEKEVPVKREEGRKKRANIKN